MRVDAGFALQAEFSPGVWTDITEDVIDSDCKASYGIKGNDPSARIAGTGQMFFELNNSHSNSAATLGYYSPGTYACREGFTGGLRVRAKFSYAGKDYYKFLGRIPKDGIKVEPGVWDSRRVSVECRDWMEHAAMYEIRGQEVASRLRADQALAMLISEMPIQPENMQFAAGQDVFETVFDKAKAGTVFMSEANRLVSSEPGYLYIKRNQTDGETLVFENRFSRYLRERDVIPVSPAFSRLLATEDMVPITTEDGIQIILDEVYDADFTDFKNLVPEYGGQIYNRVRGRVYPRFADSSPRVLARLQTPTFLVPGATVTIQIPFRDPDNRTTNVAGFGMQPAVADVDYFFNTAKDGSGFSITDDLKVEPSYSSSYVLVKFTNQGVVEGYVIDYQAVGYGVYTYDTVDFIAENESVALGAETLDLDMAYQVDPIKAMVFSQYYLNEYGEAFAGLQWVELTANVSDKHMQAFLNIEPGARVGLAEEVSGISHDFFVNGCEWDTKTDVITFRWYVSRTSDMSDDWARYDMSVYDDPAEGYAI